MLLNANALENTWFTVELLPQRQGSCSNPNSFEKKLASKARAFDHKSATILTHQFWPKMLPYHFFVFIVDPGGLKNISRML